MSISGTDRPSPRAALVFLAVSVGCGVIGYVYTLFGHGVHSFFMDHLYLWTLPGALFHGLLYLCHTVPNRAAANALAAGLATLTAGSAFKGILEIAGTSSPFESVFFTAGGVLSLAGLLLQIAVSIRRLHRSA